MTGTFPTTSIIFIWSWPPRTISISGTLEASLRSSHSLKCVNAMIKSHPYLFLSTLQTLLENSTESSYSSFPSQFSKIPSQSSPPTPKIPTFFPTIFLMMYGFPLPSVSFVPLQRILPRSHGKLHCLTKASVSSGYRSNS